ncbi:hypothetical protein AURDEDRAFT_153602 [Auricularia subglabra TFB-10046 SS5]|nr:hypothetical protein AURDEDRAFT_153602 [Auricularia subglabra TFB-10046 SS5]
MVPPLDVALGDTSGSAAAAELQPGAELLDEYVLSSQLGVVISSTLFGVICVQTHLYRTSKHSDSIWLRVLVEWVFAIEGVHTILLWVYFIQVDKRGRVNPLYLFDLSPALVFVYLMSALTGASVQSFYAYRVYRLCSRPIFAIVAWLGNVARLSLTLASVVFALRTPQAVGEFMLLHGWYLRGSFIASAAVDVWNTTTLCAILARHRRDNPPERTLSVINKLMLWTIETGLLTSIMALVVLVVVRLRLDTPHDLLLTTPPAAVDRRIHQSTRSGECVSKHFSQQTEEAYIAV